MLKKYEVSGYAKLWANVTVVIEAETEEEAMDLFDKGVAEDEIYERIKDIGDMEYEADDVKLIEESEA